MIAAVGMEVVGLDSSTPRVAARWKAMMMSVLALEEAVHIQVVPRATTRLLRAKQEHVSPLFSGTHARSTVVSDEKRPPTCSSA